MLVNYASAVDQGADRKSINQSIVKLMGERRLEQNFLCYNQEDGGWKLMTPPQHLIYENEGAVE